MSHQRRQPSIPRLPHMPDTLVTLLLSFAVVYWFSPNKRPGDRAIPPRICDIPRPTAPPVSAARPAIAFHERARNAGVAAIPPFPARAGVLIPPATTSRVVGPDA